MANKQTVSYKKVAQVMVDEYDFDPSPENMEEDRTNYSYALLDTLTALYNLEGEVDDALNALAEERGIT